MKPWVEAVVGRSLLALVRLSWLEDPALLAVLRLS